MLEHIKKLTGLYFLGYWRLAWINQRTDTVTQMAEKIFSTSSDHIQKAILDAADVSIETSKESKAPKKKEATLSDGLKL